MDHHGSADDFHVAGPEAVTDELPFKRINPMHPLVQTVAGIKRRHAVRLLEFCKGEYRGRELIIIVRQSCPESLQWHGTPQHLPKPVTLKEKIDPSTGRTPSPPSFEQSLKSGVRVLAPGTLRGWPLLKAPVAIARHPGKGWFYISDYDLHGVYELRHTGHYDRFYVSNYVNEGFTRIGSAEQSSPSLNPFLEALNRYVCDMRRGHPERAFFQHGPEDDFRVAGRSGHRLYHGKPMEERGKVTKPHLVFEHTGAVYLLSGPQVQQYFQARKLSYMW